MKLRINIFILSIIFGLSVCVVDVFLDYQFFYEGTFWELLVTNVPAHKVYIRSINLISYFIFGALLSIIITKRDQLKESLEQSEERLFRIIQNMPVMLDAMAMDERNQIVFWNREAEIVTGYTAEEMIGRSDAFSLLYPDPEYFSKIMDECSKRGDEFYNWEMVLTRKDGTTRTVSWFNISKHVPVPGWQSWAIGVDVTDRSRAEEASRDSEERYRSFVQNFRGIAYRCNKDYTSIFFQGVVEDITGYKEEDFIAGKPGWDQIMHPEDNDEELYARTKKVYSIPDFSHESEYRIIRRDGDIRWVHEHVQNVCDDSGRVVYVQGAIYDITGRKEAEQNTIKARKQAEKYLDIAGVMLATTDDRENITMLNKEGHEILGYREGELIGRNWFDVLVPERIRIKLRGVYNKLMSGDTETVEYYENLFITKDGKERMAAFHNTALRNQDNKVIGILFSGEDITARKRLEEEKEIFLHNLAERVKELNCLYSLSEIIDQHNITLDDIFTEMISIIPPSWQYPEVTCARIILRDREYKSSNFRTTKWKQASNIYINGEKSGSMEVYYLEEKPRSHEGPFLKEERNLLNALSERFGRIVERVDAVSELQKSRQELRDLAAHLQSVREAERTGIAREIHDELGQVMTALKIDLSWIKGRLPGGQDELKEKVITMSNILDSTIQTVRRISSELRPGILDDLGLISAIEWQAREIKKRSGIKFELIFEPEEIVIPEEPRVSLFRIFQETMTNVLRYSEATDVRVCLRKCDGNVEMEIKDNGKGITRKQVNDSSSLGIIGMKERVKSCNGDISIKGIKGKGTTVRVIIPHVEQELL